MAETVAWNLLRRRLATAGVRPKFIRIENSVAAGLPDGLVIWKGLHVWLEFKESQYLRRTKLYRLAKVQRRQPVTWASLREHGARVFILMRTPGEFWIFDVDAYEQLKEGVDMAWMILHNVPIETVLRTCFVGGSNGV